MKGNDMHLCWILNENKLQHEYKFINILCKTKVECTLCELYANRIYCKPLLQRIQESKCYINIALVHLIYSWNLSRGDVYHLLSYP